MPMRSAKASWLSPNRFRCALTAPPIPQRDCHGFLGVGLADDVTVQLRDDLLWRQIGEAGQSLFGAIRWHGYRERGTADRGRDCPRPPSTVPRYQASKTVIFVFVYTQISPAMRRLRSTISLGSSVVFSTNARAAASA